MRCCPRHSAGRDTLGRILKRCESRFRWLVSLSPCIAFANASSIDHYFSVSTTGIVALSDEDIRAALWTRLLSEAAHGAIGALTLQSLGAIGSEAPSVSLATVSPNAALFDSSFRGFLSFEDGSIVLEKSFKR
eukprot:COSAG04_NODE_323_length_16882_cov_5.975627_13_plen_133_part_00